jgi:UDP:flavonoid glycosyltransferase YjiC (YdhE family)
MSTKKRPPTYEVSEQEHGSTVDPPPPFEPQAEADSQTAGPTTRLAEVEDGRVTIDIDNIDKRLLARLEREQSTAPSESTLQQVPSRPANIPGPLNIVIHVVGSRGDVQPFLALGLVLKNQYGHRVRLATHGTFKKFVEENGLEFFDIGGDPAELMAFMVKNPGLIPGMKSIRAGDIGKRKKGMAEIVRGCWRSCADQSEAGADDEQDDKDKNTTNPKPFVAHAIIANPPSFAHIHCAEKLGIPLHLMFTMPWSPTSEFPQPIANIKSLQTSGGGANKLSYTIVEMMTWEGLGSVINNFREESLDLPELSQAAATTAIHRLRIPYTYCWSPALIPKPKDWGRHIDIAGFYFLPLGSNYQPENDLAEFLAAGPPPVYIGFGSIVVDDPNAMTKMMFEAVAKTGQRALVSKGWGGLGGDELGKPDDVFMLGNCPHDWLFKQVSCVVHHGGAGTTAAGIASGRPTVIVPFFGDQPFWGAMVARAGAGPKPIPYKDLTADALAEAITFALKSETLDRAKELGERIRDETGAETGAAAFHAHLDVERMRCMVSPSRPAVWQIKSKGLKSEGARLSAFGATVLSDKGLLDMNELKLYRSRDYELEDVTGYASRQDANPLLSTAGSVANRILRMPVNYGKALGGIVWEPVKGARDGGWSGFGKGMGKGLGNFLFPKRGTYMPGGAFRFGVRSLYEVFKKRFGDQKLGFILATHFATGFEEMRNATEEERQEVLRRWGEVPVAMKDTGKRSSE